MLRAGDRNTNEGANAVLSVSGSGNTRIVLDFLAPGYIPYLGPGCTVLLSLDIVDNAGNWGPNGKFISVHPLTAGFTEGNGKSWGLPPAAQTKGSGPGVTWNCASDTNVTNQAADCASGWSGGEIDLIIDSVLVTNDTTGTITFDLFDWVDANPYAPLRFLIKKDNDGAPGRVDFYSKEGAGPTLAPRITTSCPG